MDLNFNDVRTKDIVDIKDGKILGRATDIIFDQNNSTVKGFSVPIFKKGFSLKKPECLFISIKNIVKIGLDVILVNTGDREIVDDKDRILVPKVFKRMPKIKQC